MFGFKKRSQNSTPETITEKEQPAGFFRRLVSGLSRSRANLANGLGNLFLGRKQIDAELFEELETILLTADVGIETTTQILAELSEQVKRRDLKDPQILLTELRNILVNILAPHVQELVIGNQHPHLILVVGVNGSGKTTTIGKLAYQLKQDGFSVMLAAGDTFRAAAVEQLQIWGERNKIPVVAQQTGSDSASVIYDAIQSASAKKCEVLLADTAGRLHTKSNLMLELKKIIKVIQKINPQAPHEVLLVLDASIGQNALQQALEFNAAVPLTGIAITKLDGTAKAGIIFAIANRLRVPIKLIGVGEAIEDLRPFQAHEFVEALFATREN